MKIGNLVLLLIGIVMVALLSSTVNCGRVVSTADSTTTTSTTSTTTTTTPPIPGFIVSGVVSWESYNHYPLAGVLITLEGSSTQTTSTDSSGRYNFTGLATGEYTMNFSYQAGWLITPEARVVTMEGFVVTNNATAELSNWGAYSPLAILGYDFQALAYSSQGGGQYMVLVGGAPGAGGIFVWSNNFLTWNDLSFGSGNSQACPTSEVLTFVYFDGNINGMAVAERNGNLRAVSNFLFGSGVWSESWTYDSVSYDFLGRTCRRFEPRGEGFYLTEDGDLHTIDNRFSLEAVSYGFQPFALSLGMDAGEDYPALLSNHTRYLHLVGQAGKYSKTVSGYHLTEYPPATQEISSQNLTGVAVMFSSSSPSSYTNNIWAVAQNGQILYSTDRGVNWQTDALGIPVKLNNVVSQGSSITSAKTFICGDNGLLLKRRN